MVLELLLFVRVVVVVLVGILIALWNSRTMRILQQQQAMIQYGGAMQGFFLRQQSLVAFRTITVIYE